MRKYPWWAIVLGVLWFLIQRFLVLLLIVAAPVTMFVLYVIYLIRGKPYRAGKIADR